jgi:NADPH-dependent glutamate synthase beta subunit-like oxidoreductase
MITLTIDNRKVQVPEGSMILDAALKMGIHIPTLCHSKGFKPSTSCMVCVVHVEGLNHLVPACGTRVADNMVVVTENEQVTKSRKTAIELLLSDHIGDCVGPCVVGCPANMNIPRMLRQIVAGDLVAAIQTVKKDIPLPAILGRLCSAPCEKVCRRSQHDQAVSVCLLKRFVADVDLQSASPYQPECAKPVGKKVAILGAGPAGLSVAYYLKQFGIDPVLYDDHDQPGGSLRHADIDRDLLPLEIIEKEIEQILGLGIEFQSSTPVGSDVSMAELKDQYDAVLIAVGTLVEDISDTLKVVVKDNKIKTNRPDYTTSEKGIFAAGGCTGSRNLCIRAVADGKEAAFSIRSYLLGLNGPLAKDYNHRMGRVETEQMQTLLKLASGQGRIKPEKPKLGYDPSRARYEALRCLHCDCRNADACKLRELATAFGSRQNTWQGLKGSFSQVTDDTGVIYEPGKCIKCGLCVQVAEKQTRLKGLAFQGRGFNMEVVVPLNMTLAEGLVDIADQCVRICPTGALCFKSNYLEQS